MIFLDFARDLQLFCQKYNLDMQLLKEIWHGINRTKRENKEGQVQELDCILQLFRGYVNLLKIQMSNQVCCAIYCKLDQNRLYIWKKF